MEFKDYYKVMGVARDATEAQIKQAYRKLARKYHPDVSKEKDAEARFKEVGEAYEVLKSPEKRAAYDQLGQGRSAGEDFRPPPDWGAGFEFSGAGGRDSDYSDFFESLFGARATRRRPARRLPSGSGRRPSCESAARSGCHAAAAAPGRSVCAYLKSMPTDGWRRRSGCSMSKCPRASSPASTFDWRARARALAAKGRPAILFIEVEFQPHPLYRVDGRDLYLDLPVAPWEAALGAAVKTPTPTGTVDLKIPAGSHAGSKLRLKGRGIPASPPGRLLRRSADRAAAAPTTTRPKPPTRPWPRPCPSILAQHWECKRHVPIGKSSAGRRHHSRNPPCSPSRN